MRILVTGGSGLVGSAISNTDETDKIGSFQADLRNQMQTERIFDFYKPTHVIHTAAKVGGVKANMEKGGEFYRDNILINTNVIDACRKFNVEKIVNFASTCIFPYDATHPLTVDKIFEGEPHHSNAPYAYAKRMAMVQLKAYKAQYGLKSATIIPCNIYGPNDNYDLNDCHVIPALIKKCSNAKRDNEDFVVWGSGDPLREFIFSGDVARYAEKMLLSDYEGEMIVSPGPEQEYSIRDIATMIADKLEFYGNIVFDDSKPDGQYRKGSDNSKCEEFRDSSFGTHSLSCGLDITIRSFLENNEEPNTPRSN
jgi:GDP-L-fucose synthase